MHIILKFKKLVHFCAWQHCSNFILFFPLIKVLKTTEAMSDLLYIFESFYDTLMF